MGFLRRILDFTRYGQARRLSEARAVVIEAWSQAHAHRQACLDAAEAVKARGDTRALGDHRRAARAATHAELSAVRALRAHV